MSDDGWEPLSVRRGVKASNGLHPGMPKHLHIHVRYWLEGQFGYRGTGDMNRSLIYRVATRSEVPLKANTYSPGDAMKELIVAGERDQDVYLDILDALLHEGLTSGAAGYLRDILTNGRSEWTVAEDGRSLVQRVDPTAQAAASRAIEPQDAASDELAEAWARTYGRDPDASDAWDHSIKAIEALAIPIVVPKQSKATLGHVLGELDRAGSPFDFLLDDGGGADLSILVAMLRLVWPNPNTVQLDAEDGGGGWAGGLGPFPVAGAFDVPADVLALDQPRVASMSTDRVEPAAQQHDGVTPPVVSALRGKNRAPRRSSGERCGGRRRS